MNEYGFVGTDGTREATREVVCAGYVLSLLFFLFFLSPFSLPFLSILLFLFSFLCCSCFLSRFLVFSFLSPLSPLALFLTFFCQSTRTGSLSSPLVVLARGNGRDVCDELKQGRRECKRGQRQRQRERAIDGHERQTDRDRQTGRGRERGPVEKERHRDTMNEREREEKYRGRKENYMSSSLFPFSSTEHLLTELRLRDRSQSLISLPPYPQREITIRRDTLCSCGSLRKGRRQRERYFSCDRSDVTWAE